MLRIGFIGAGGVNFGSAEGPWDHASRLERLGDVEIVGIADPDTSKAEKILEHRRQGPHGSMYTNTNIRARFQDMIELDKPDAVFIGLPPHCHGLSEAPFNVECVCADAGVHMFVEKPVSSYEPSRLAETMKKIVEARKRGVVTSVGYMFRYSRSVDKMREIIAEEAAKRGLPEGTNHLTAIIARYNCAYSLIDKKFWWDMRSSGGPIVEQCTHFADLVRYISGSECNSTTLNAMAIHSDTPIVGKLNDMVMVGDAETIEQSIPLEHHVPRTTMAMWKFESGTMCQFTHGVQLHGSKYESEIEVWADGLRMTLENPYSVCRLVVRRPHQGENNGDVVEEYEFEDSGGTDPSADPYFNEVKCFIDAIKTGDHSLIRSSYEDAFKTYELTWAIKRATEQSRQ